MANPKNIDEIRKLIKEHGLEVDSKSEARRLLIDGLDNIKNRVDYNNRLKEAGNVFVDVDHMCGWIGNLVRDTLGGRIDANRQIVIWNIDNKDIEYDPYSGKVEYAS